MSKRTVELCIKVRASAAVTDKEVCTIVQKLIDIGLSDAADSVESGEDRDIDAETALDLDIGPPKLRKSSQND